MGKRIIKTVEMKKGVYITDAEVKPLAYIPIEDNRPRLVRIFSRKRKSPKELYDEINYEQKKILSK